MTPWIAGAWILAAALVGTGLVGLFAPATMAHGYGLPDHGAGSAPGFVRAAAVRDLFFGLALGAGAYFHDLVWVVALAVAGAGLAIADFFIAYHHGGRRLRPQHAFHATGAVAFLLVVAMALFAVGR